MEEWEREREWPGGGVEPGVGILGRRRLPVGMGVLDANLDNNMKRERKKRKLSENRSNTIATVK